MKELLQVTPRVPITDYTVYPVLDGISMWREAIRILLNTSKQWMQIGACFMEPSNVSERPAFNNKTISMAYDSEMNVPGCLPLPLKPRCGTDRTNESE